MAVKITLGSVVLMVLIASPLWLRETELQTYLSDTTHLRGWILDLGIVGPLAVIALMIVAILISPLPSAPIALAAGAVFGHVWGTVYVLLGSVSGAVAAFGLARLLGHEVLHRRFGDRLSVGLAGSQNALMTAVFITRLLPFLSFDLVSYAAGLTNITFVRFFTATLAGILPASFLLAHFGSEFATEEMESILISALLLGLLTVVPFGIKIYVDQRKQHSAKTNGAKNA